MTTASLVLRPTTRRLSRLPAVLCAVTLLVAACGGSDQTAEGDSDTDQAAAIEETAENETGIGDDEVGEGEGTDVEGTDVADTEDEAGDTGTSDEDPFDDVTTDPAAASLFLATLFAQMGLESTDELIACIEDRGVDTNTIPITDEEGASFTLAMFGCAPDETGAAFATEVTAEGVSQEDATCVLSETFRYLGQLPPDEAVEAFNAVTIPQEHQDALLPIVEEVCGLDPATVLDVIES